MWNTNITTSVDSFDKLNCLQGVVDESTSTKRYISQIQSFWRCWYISEYCIHLQAFWFLKDTVAGLCGNWREKVVTFQCWFHPFPSISCSLINTLSFIPQNTHKTIPICCLKNQCPLSLLSALTIIENFAKFYFIKIQFNKNSGLQITKWVFAKSYYQIKFALSI